MGKTVSLDEFAGMRDTSFALMKILNLTADDLKDPVHYARFERVVKYLHNMENWDVLARRITQGKTYDKLTLLDEYRELNEESQQAKMQMTEYQMASRELADAIDRGEPRGTEFLELQDKQKQLENRLAALQETIQSYE